jgi:hypothetical protein
MHLPVRQELTAATDRSPVGRAGTAPSRDLLRASTIIAMKGNRLARSRFWRNRVVGRFVVRRRQGLDRPSRADPVQQHAAVQTVAGAVCVAGQALVEPSGGVSQRSDMAEEESGGTGRLALPTGASRDGVTPRDRWGHALTPAMPDYAASTRAMSLAPPLRFVSHSVCKRHCARKFSTRSRWADQVGFNRRAGIAAVSYPLLHRRCRRTTVRAAVGRVPGYRP